MTVPDRVVFDAEPLIAHADDEPGSAAVEEYLDAVAAGGARGYLSRVNRTEVRYAIARKYDRDTADEYLGWLTALGVESVDVEETWFEASEHVLAHNPALGDAFALATADRAGATLLVGGDDDYDAVESVPIERFRDGSA
ncbi:PIN domain-containing protein [Halorubrum sp. 2020YC2]|uniref:type II toxin-antitoxin system VapC family toxin n=1 Tax=Halorubrum sp. 2020YC2 TaxID=2836432 RepID=UPI001BEA5BC9|nr:PIN domain-containing protein [Halorubrum sp. 2020YC2]QWC20531.1 PIN domain-containing protein [Halorubrum sp. 2020YC2]